MMFICINFTKLNNVAELLTLEALKTVLEREDVNCTTDRLLVILNTCVTFNCLYDPQPPKMVQKSPNFASKA